MKGFAVQISLHFQRRGQSRKPPGLAQRRHFHSRPFLVLNAHRFTDALIATITEPALKALPPVGAIDQYVDSTDLTDRNHTGRRVRYIAGPGS